MSKDFLPTKPGLRLKKYGPNRLKPKRQVNAARLFLSQFTSPIILILLFAAVLSFFLGDATDSIIIMVIVLFSGALGFWQEYEASNAVEDLMALVQLKAMVVRDGREVEVPFEEVVPGRHCRAQRRRWRARRRPDHRIEGAVHRRSGADRRVLSRGKGAG